MNKRDIREISEKELAEFLVNNQQPEFRKTQIYKWLWSKGVKSFDAMTDLSKEFRLLLSDHFEFRCAEIVDVQVSADGTKKFAFKLFDNEIVEGVLIPSYKRTTACISSQVGCNVKCTFCATGTMKFKRNLTAGEIFDQVFAINIESEKTFGDRLDNIVYMGMGEPLLNYDNVLRSIHFVSSEKGLAMSPKRITVSTSGIPDKIKKLADDNVKFNLALSLHSANHLKRNSLMPINKTYNLELLIEAIKYFNEKTGTRTTFEYLMILNVNDTMQDAKDLASFCKNFPSKINLIEYNVVEGTGYQKSTKENIQKFLDFLLSKNMVVNLRQSKGEDIDAACGQLAAKKVIV